MEDIKNNWLQIVSKSRNSFTIDVKRRENLPISDQHLNRKRNRIDLVFRRPYNAAARMALEGNSLSSKKGKKC